MSQGDLHITRDHDAGTVRVEKELGTFDGTFYLNGIPVPNTGSITVTVGETRVVEPLPPSRY